MQTLVHFKFYTPLPQPWSLRGFFYCRRDFFLFHKRLSLEWANAGDESEAALWSTQRAVNGKQLQMLRVKGGSTLHRQTSSAAASLGLGIKIHLHYWCKKRFYLYFWIHFKLKVPLQSYIDLLQKRFQCFFNYHFTIFRQNLKVGMSPLPIIHLHALPLAYPNLKIAVNINGEQIQRYPVIQFWTKWRRSWI